MPATTRRRVSYVIPPPNEPVQRLQLPPFAVPRNGATGPHLIPSPNSLPYEVPKSRHPRHRLGVVSLALDTSTHLAGRSAPEGILYSGARDGLVCSWDLELPMRKREEEQRRFVGRWEGMTGWGDDVIDEEEDSDDKIRSDGDILGEVSSPRRRRADGSIPYEQSWEIDSDAYKPGQPTQFRQCSQTHTDWVNDMLLCNYNQTVVSASSDGSIKGWNPHSSFSTEPFTIGTHSDYVRCLAYSREQRWVASGSFDRTIKLWDLSRSSMHSEPVPLITLNPPDASAPKASIYALATDPFGHTIASASPERVIRMWDPRSGKRTAKLVGHTDNIRAMLISEDSRYLLTGSADASIKLWSLKSQRCLHTFTYHTDSVWSLFSSHPSLETFYSGDKTGLVCRVDVEDCADVSEGECIVVCQDPGERSMAASEGINKIVALDDNILWTASGSSSIKRWKAPLRRADRASMLNTSDRCDSPIIAKRRTTTTSIESPRRFSTTSSVRDREENTLFGIPFESMVRLSSPNDPFTSFAPASRGRDPEVATLYSAASIISISNPQATVRAHSQSQIPPLSIHGALDDSSQLHSANDTQRTAYEARELATHAAPLYSTPDDIVQGDHGLVRSVILNDRIHALTVDISGQVAVWDIVRGICLGIYPRNEVAGAGESAYSGGSGDRKERSPREALEAVRERIEGEAVISQWASVDTKTGVLTVHLTERCFEAEIYADEAGFGPDRRFNDEMRLNIGKWVLRNIFIGFIREEQRARRTRNIISNTNEPQALQKVSALLESAGTLSRNQSWTDVASQMQNARSPGASSPFAFPSVGSTVMASPRMIPAIAPTPIGSAAPTARSSPLIAPFIPLQLISKDIPSLPMPAIPQSPEQTDSLPTPMPRPHARTLTEGPGHGSPTASSVPKDGDYFSMRTRHASAGAHANSVSTPDELAAWSGAKANDPGVPQTPLTPGAGLMGRLKNFGKVGAAGVKKGGVAGGIYDMPISPVIGANAFIEDGPIHNGPRPKTPQQVLLSGTLTPPSSNEAPTLTLPPSTVLVIAEEAYPGWNSVYRGSVASTWTDVTKLEDAMPLWLLEYLLTNKVPAVPVSKVGFVLLPWMGDGEPLPELLNTTQSKLTASRFLRVRKLCSHVQDKLDRMSHSAATSKPGSPRSSVDSKKPHSGSMSPPAPHSHSTAHSSTASPSPSIFSSRTLDGKERGEKAEDMYEILCNDTLLPLDMTLAAVRQYVWRQSGELTMHYRRRAFVHVGEAQ
ncbi:WD40 repeat-like protein [Athelia psychrophila]|uniref:WD40 repeat-like protein n=1 Tax=Athelia psychrophila TaxID=1759441 RepID=A0A166PA88_9AGAM|nr:WD40 repeat-like protein [Fibularhizoctonia sp. CBS 109695]